jgi:hypothetical protein
LDEIFRLTREHVTIVKGSFLTAEIHQLLTTTFSEPMTFVVIQPKEQSKSGPTDPDAIRFVDVALLNLKEILTLIRLMQEEGKIFRCRASLTKALTSMRYSQHSLKKGASDLLSHLLKQGLIPETILPLVLKHLNSLEQIGSVTVGYLSNAGRINLLIAKKMFHAAIWIRQTAEQLETIKMAKQ